MHVLALIVTLVAALGWVATFAGLTSAVPVLDQISANIWGIVAIVGLIVWFITRRPAD